MTAQPAAARRASHGHRTADATAADATLPPPHRPRPRWRPSPPSLGEAMTKSGLLWIDVARRPRLARLARVGRRCGIRRERPGRAAAALAARGGAGHPAQQGHRRPAAHAARAHPRPRARHSRSGTRPPSSCAPRGSTPPTTRSPAGRAACTLTALVPFDSPLEAPGAYAAGDARSAPARTAATTTSWRPWHWRGRGEEKAARKRAKAAERTARKAARERAKLRAKRQRRGGRLSGG